MGRLRPLPVKCRAQYIMGMSGSKSGKRDPEWKGQYIGLEPEYRYSDVIGDGDSLQLLIL